MNMEAKSIIKWSEVSIALTGNPNTIRADKSYKKYAAKIEPLLDYIQNWIDNKGETKEVKVTVKVPEVVVEGFLPKPVLTVGDAMVIAEDEFIIAELNEIQGSVAIKSTKTPKPEYKLVDALPTDRVIVTDAGVRGLYECKNKYYTNKVCEGKLEIREWKKQDAAVKYLESFKA